MRGTQEQKNLEITCEKKILFQIPTVLNASEVQSVLFWQDDQQSTIKLLRFLFRSISERVCKRSKTKTWELV